MEKLTIVSVDSHATVPVDRWPDYLEKRYHDLLPRLRSENEIWPPAMWLLSSYVMNVPGLLEAHRSEGARGALDAAARLEQMDQEGVAAEVVYHGDFRTSDVFHNVSNDAYPLDAWEAGARAYNRWAHDELGSSPDRLLLVGAIGPCVDLDVTVAEIDWIADHGFVGTFAPGFMTHPAMPPLSAPYWDPFWAACAARDLAVVVHAGYGFGHGEVYPEVERIYKHVEEHGGGEVELVTRLTSEVFGQFFTDIKPRRAMWQMMLGGVFDRHPDLRLMMTEVRLDWIPALLEHLDGVFDAPGADLPATRRPSEYWQSNCMAGASFVHKAEVEMRDEIGVATIAFGRDYPHPEGTWPHTQSWLHDAFRGVPEDELRAMLGGNAIRFLGLDAGPLDAIAARLGPTVEAVAGGAADASEELLANFDLRGGYLRPAERGERLPEMDGMVRDDLTRAGASV